MERNSNEYLTERIHKQGCRIIELEAENAKLRDLIRRAVSYVVWADMEVHDFGGTCTDHAQLADEIKQAIGPLPGEGGE